MAITNAQQYQQLVNPPMKGNKRPGYRGTGEYGGMGGGTGSGLGEGPAGGGSSGGNGGEARDRAMGLQGKTGRRDTSLDTGGGFGNVDRSAVGQFSQYGRNVMAQNLKGPNVLERGVDLLKKISPTYNIVKGLTSIFGTKKKVFQHKVHLMETSLVC